MKNQQNPKSMSFARSFYTGIIQVYTLNGKHDGVYQRGCARYMVQISLIERCSVIRHSFPCRATRQRPGNGK
jgi:hypothetical protein